MSTDRPDPAAYTSRGEMWEDLELKRRGSIPGFERTSSGAVLYAPVCRNGNSIGFLWASLDGKAADFMAHASAGIEDRNATGHWVQRMINDHKLGLTSTAALEKWIGNVSEEGAGEILPGTVPERADSLSLLKEINSSL